MDLIAATGLVILLKLDSNHWFFSPYDLEIRWMTSKNNRTPPLGYSKLCALFQSHQWIQAGWPVLKHFPYIITEGSLTEFHQHETSQHPSLPDPVTVHSDYDMPSLCNFSSRFARRPSHQFNFVRIYNLIKIRFWFFYIHVFLISSDNIAVVVCTNFRCDQTSFLFNQ